MWAHDGERYCRVVTVSEYWVSVDTNGKGVILPLPRADTAIFSDETMTAILNEENI